MEDLLHDKFLKRRSQGWRVTYAWLRAQMKILCEKHKPEHYDPTKHKFKNSWVRRFCRRKNISLRKKGNKKCSSVYERLHQIKNYDHFLIYQMQDPSNWDDKFFTHDVFLKKKSLPLIRMQILKKYNLKKSKNQWSHPTVDFEVNDI